jgi:hypothetical protein
MMEEDTEVMNNRSSKLRTNVLLCIEVRHPNPKALKRNMIKFEMVKF